MSDTAILILIGCIGCACIVFITYAAIRNGAAEDAADEYNYWERDQ